MDVLTSATLEIAGTDADIMSLALLVGGGFFNQSRRATTDNEAVKPFAELASCS